MSRRLLSGLAAAWCLSSHLCLADPTPVPCNSANVDAVWASRTSTDAATVVTNLLGFLDTCTGELHARSLAFVGHLRANYLNTNKAQGVTNLETAISEAETASAPCTAIRARYFLAQALIFFPNLTATDTAAQILEDAQDDETACNDDVISAYLWRWVAAECRSRGDQVCQAAALETALTHASSTSEHLLEARLTYSEVELEHDLGETTGIETALNAVKSDAISNSWHDLECSVLGELTGLYRDLGEYTDALSAADDWISAAGDCGDAELALARAGKAWAMIDNNDGPLGIIAARAQLNSADRSDLVGGLKRNLAFYDLLDGRLLLLEGETEDGEALLTTLLEDETQEPEVTWRAAELLGLSSRLKGDPTEEAQRLALAVSILEAQRQVTQIAFAKLAWRSQRVGLHHRWIEALLAGGDAHPERRRPRPFPSAEAAFSAAAADPDTLLAAVDRLASYATDLDIQAAGGVGAWLARQPSPPAEADRNLLARARALRGVFPQGEALRALLPPGVPVFLYQPLSRETLILEVRREGTRVYRAPLGRAALADLSGALREALERRSPDADELLDYLGETLLGPFADGLRQDQPVGFVLQGEADGLPMAALRHRDRYLVERVFPFELPNLDSLRWIARHPPAGGPLRALGVGLNVDAFDKPESLFYVEDELSWLERPGFETRIVTGIDASVGRVASLLPDYDLIHLAGHGSPPETPRAADLPPRAPAETGPEDRGLAALHLLDGPLTANTLADVGLNARLVVLDGCDTRIGRGHPLDAAWGALAREALQGGSQAVIATRWLIGDEAAWAFTERLYEHYTGADAARALAEAQRDLIGSDAPLSPLAARQWAEDFDARPVAVTDLRQAHPGVWAAYGLLGRWE